ncbi:MAG: hypothetical protein U1B80_08680 [Anaerolineaceae bacterium]|nr:hypothetical protein [Anaerolineaceae bacterium]
MLDDLRDSATISYGDEQPSFTRTDTQPGYDYANERTSFLGMSAPQRLVLALLLLFMTCVLGSFCLILTERVVPPVF